MTPPNDTPDSITHEGDSNHIDSPSLDELGFDSSLVDKLLGSICDVNAVPAVNAIMKVATVWNGLPLLLECPGEGFDDKSNVGNTALEILHNLNALTRHIGEMSIKIHDDTCTPDEEPEQAAVEQGDTPTPDSEGEA